MFHINLLVEAELRLLIIKKTRGHHKVNNWANDYYLGGMLVN